MDRIQHYLWNHIWEDDPDSDVVTRIREHFAYMDSIVGKIYSAIKDEAILLICSDHGFGDYKGNFYPAVWLKQKGYYVEKDDRLTFKTMVKRILKALGLNKPILRFLERSQKTVAKKLIYVGTSQVAWRKTRAYAYGTSGIRINLKGRDQYGIVEPGKDYEDLRSKIKQELMDLKDAAGRKVIGAVYTAEELYGVAGLPEVPDLIFESRDDNYHATYDVVTDNKVFLDRPHSWRQGDHRRDGIVALAGRGIAPGKIITADIEDLLPTIMFIENLPLSRTYCQLSCS
jgi:predicted AlkP superfamily phosphohydrolase/phosphomutase